MTALDSRGSTSTIQMTVAAAVVHQGRGDLEDRHAKQGCDQMQFEALGLPLQCGQVVLQLAQGGMVLCMRQCISPVIRTKPLAETVETSRVVLLKYNLYVLCTEGDHNS